MTAQEARNLSEKSLQYTEEYKRYEEAIIKAARQGLRSTYVRHSSENEIQYQVENKLRQEGFSLEWDENHEETYVSW